jgi:hypothetical protein
VPAPAILSGVRLAVPAFAGPSVRDDPRMGTRLPATAGAGAGLRHGLGRVLWVLGGFGEMLIVGYAFPLVILAIGIPIALFVRLVLETGRALWQL